jgi:hypothetical protein
MGRTMIAALIATGMLAGCTDWREGEETVAACLERFAPKKGADDPLANDPGVWVPSYTYDITKLDGLLEFGRDVMEGGGTTRIVASTSGSPHQGLLQQERDRFDGTPATAAGAVLLIDDPALYKVRGEPGLYRDLLRQGCERQRAGMRLINWQFTRADQLVNGELPPSRLKAAERRAMQKHIKPAFSIEDLLP